MFDVFYTKQKPQLFPHERIAESLDDARAKSRTKFFWFVDGSKDYREFDFAWLPPKWEEHQTHIHLLTSQFGEQFEAVFAPKHCTEKIDHYYDRKLVTRKADPANWVILKNEAKWDIDPTWCPNPWEEPFIYVFGNPWYSAVEMPTAEYRVPGASQYKYVDEPVITLKADTNNWAVIIENAEGKKINWQFSDAWLPNPFEPPYIYAFKSKWFPDETVVAEYRVPGATEYKYVDEEVATVKTDPRNWKIIVRELDGKPFNWKVNEKWAPNPFDPPYIYAFRSRWLPPETIVAEYHVPGATEYKFVDDEEVTLESDGSNWAILKPTVDWTIDKSWAPNPFDPPYIYVFGNPWYSSVEMPTVEYRVPGATEYKYMDDPVVTVQAKQQHWNIKRRTANGAAVKWNIDAKWAPNPFEDPYIYAFRSSRFPADEIVAEYRIPGATEYKYVDEEVLTLTTDEQHWRIIRDNVDGTKIKWLIDESWAPDPFDPPYNYAFFSQWFGTEEVVAEYRVPGATEYKYIDQEVIYVKTNPLWWNIIEKNADTSTLKDWAPNPFDPPFIYVFGNQWYPAEIMPTAEYRMPGATEVKYVAEAVAQLLPTKEHWTVPEEVDASKIDFSWVPHPKEQPYIYHFSSEFQMSIGLLYTVPGATEPKFETEVPIKREGDAPKKFVQTVDMFFVDMNNKMANARYEALKLRYPDMQKIRFMNGWVETIKRCVTRSKTTKFWVISSENVYDEFNFEWHAQPWQNFMTHVFGSQWQKWSDTFLINKNEFVRHSKWAKTLEEFPNLNFVKDQPVYRPDDIYDIYYIDHYNEGSKENLERISKRYPGVHSVRFVDNYLDTIKRVVSHTTTEYVWVTSSLCDYARFDFTWQPEPWQGRMLHVFPSNEQKFGDTFYIHVPSLREQIDTLELLEWFDTTNFCNDQSVPRLPMQQVYFDSDSIVPAIAAHTFDGPYALFQSIDSDAILYNNYAPSLWRKKDRSIHVFTDSGSVCVVPRDAKAEIKTQCYDYPYIMRHNTPIYSEKSLDIVYISNGEPDAERWYEHLCNVAHGRTIHRVSNVNGRSAAYKAAANASTTPWFFTVFAKLEVEPNFNWDWKPDRLQEPKHYIFHAKNPVNGLVYGHQAMIAYNKALTLGTNEHGLDFTLSAAHEVVPAMSGTAHYNVDAWTTWRTAFREVLKLKDYSINNLNDINAEYRLNVWCTVAEGTNAEWSLRGAQDAIAFYDQCQGDPQTLLRTYEWDYLRSIFDRAYA